MKICYKYYLSRLAIAILFLFVIMMIQIHLPQERVTYFYQFNPIFFFSLFLLFLFSSLSSSPSILTFFYPSWAISFKTMTDIETLAIGIAVAYPTA